ncbi:hypothetical protein D6C99_04630 [Aureobasidium pullulans]|nr:hypothetical protein D6C99_04630 [Aureobasidium pullulans]
MTRILRTFLVGTICVTSILCILQFWYINHVVSTTSRNTEDNFIFSLSTWTNIHWSSPEIWDPVRQEEIRNVMPVAVHSHNDYTRRIPLWEAIGSGCVSVEADVHLDRSDLLVGHSARGLKRKDSIKAMYLEPLERLIGSRNVDVTEGGWRGVFEKVPEQTLVLLVDLKTESRQTLQELSRQLKPLRELDYLTYWNGTSRIIRPLTIVASGKIAFEDILALNPTHRDIFFDAPLASLHTAKDDWTTSPPTHAYNISNSYYASSELKDGIISLASDGVKTSSPEEQDASSSQPEQAKSRGLVSRYWGSAGPKYQTSEQVMWRYFTEIIGIGIINMDDMAAVRDRARGMGKMAIQEKN